MSEWMKELDERQQREIMFARGYAREYAHGTDGHSRLILLAKLAELLDKYSAPAVLLTVADKVDFDPSKPVNPRKPQGFA